MTQPLEGNRRPSSSTLMAVFLILTLAVVTVVGAVTAFQLPDAVTETDDDVVLLYQATLAISFFVFFIVSAGIICAIFRYRRRGPEMPEQIHGSTALEMTWTIIPIIILIALFIPSLIILLDQKNPPDDEDVGLTVEAIGHQWWWEFNYPDDGVRIQAVPPDYDDLTPPTLVIPVDTLIVIKVSSTDVIHSFPGPNNLYKVHAVPGTINQMHFAATETGTYAGQCFQFCGLRHSDMLFVIEILPQDEYERWLNETKVAQGVIEGEESNRLGASSGESE